VVEQLFSVALRAGDFDTARRYVDIAVSKDIDKVGGRVFKAQLALAQDKVDEAIGMIDEAIKIRPRYGQAHRFLGACYMKKGRLDLAQPEYEAAQQLNPSDVSALLGLMAISERQGKPLQHAHWVELAYKFRPDHPKIREDYLALQESRQKPEAVIQHREQIRRSHPNDLANLYHLGSLYERVKQFANAETVYRELVAKAKNSPQAVRMLTNLLYRTDRDAEARGILSRYADQADDKVLAYLLWAEYLENAGKTAVARSRLAKAIELGGKDDPRGERAMAQFEARQGKWTAAADHERKAWQVLEGAAKDQAERRLIMFLIEAGDREEVNERINAALARNPKDVEALTLRGLAAYSQGDYAHAKQSLDYVLTTSPGHVNARIYRAQVHLAEGNKDLALRDLQAAQRLSSSPTVPMRLVAIYDSMEDFQGAYNVLQQILNERPGDMAALQAAVSLCRSYGKWRELAQIIREARKAYPQEEQFIIQQADALQRLGRYPEAVRILQAAQQILPDSAGVSLALAEALLWAGQADQGLAVARKLRDHPDLGYKAIALCGRARQAVGDTAKSDADFQQAIKQADDRRRLTYVIAQLRQTYRDDPAGLIDRLTRWGALRPGSWVLPSMLADVYMKQKDYAKARQVLAEGALVNAKEDPERFEVLMLLGQACQLGKQFEPAKDYYEQALNMNPNDKTCLNNLAWMLAFDLKDLDNALPLAERAYRQAPFSAHALDTYGVILQMTGKLDEAGIILRKSVNIKAMPANRYHLAEYLEKTGRKAEALREYKAAWNLAKDLASDDEYRQKTRQALERLGEPPEERTQP